jgi:hypothetical protein
LTQDAANRDVYIHALYPLIPNLTALTQQSTLVVEGTVLDNGTTTLVDQPVAQPQSSPAKPAPSGPLPGDKGQLIAATHPNAPTNQAALPDQRLPVTSYTIQIDKVLRGQAPGGNKLTLLLTGGPVSYPTFPLGPTLHRTLVFEGNPLLKRADRQVFFLGVNPDGTYYLVGGPQGRLQVTEAGIHILTRAPATRGLEGVSESQFSDTIHAIP